MLCRIYFVKLFNYSTPTDGLVGAVTGAEPMITILISGLALTY